MVVKKLMLAGIYKPELLFEAVALHWMIFPFSPLVFQHSYLSYPAVFSSLKQQELVKHQQQHAHIRIRVHTVQIWT